MSTINRITLMCLLVATSLLACESSMTPGECKPSGVIVTPDSVSLAVGDTITFHSSAVFGDCLPADTAAAQLRWRLGTESDSGVAIVDSLTGFVTALKIGHGSVDRITPNSHWLLGSASIQVHP